MLFTLALSLWELNFLHSFVTPSSSRHNTNFVKCWGKIFVVFHLSRNISYSPDTLQTYLDNQVYLVQLLIMTAAIWIPGLPGKALKVLFRIISKTRNPKTFLATSLSCLLCPNGFKIVHIDYFFPFTLKVTKFFVDRKVKIICDMKFMIENWIKICWRN